MKFGIAYKILLLLAVITASIPLGLAAGESLSAGTFTVASGSTVIVPVMVGNANLVAGGNIKLNFNPAIVNVVSVSSGTVSGTRVSRIDNTTGLVSIAISGTTAVGTASAILANITIRGVSAGTSTLGFQPYPGSYLSKEDGSLITPTISNGSITVTGDSGSPILVSSITPNSRSAQVGTPVTIFMTVINGGTATATGVSITQASSLPVTVSYQQWTGSAFIGSADTPADLAAGAIANYVLTINPTSAFTTSSLTFNVASTNGATASISGVNTLTMSASSVAAADIIMMATGTMDYRTAVGTPMAFAVATMNVGTAAATGVSFEVSIPSSITGLVTQVNETNPDGSIKGPATGLTIPVGATPTFAVFLTPTQPIALDYVANRIVVQLRNGAGDIIGAQSVAVSTT